MTRKEFVAELETNGSGATFRLSTPSRDHQVITAISRHRGCLNLLLPSGHGISFHRNGGISLCGIPSSGGMTIAWGNVRRRLRTLGRKRRAIELGPIGIYVGRDF